MLWFTEEGRAQALAGNPGKPMATIATICGGIWNMKSREEKLVWETEAKKKKKAFYEEKIKDLAIEADGSLCVIC
jgi:hypothetical protein